MNANEREWGRAKSRRFTPGYNVPRRWRGEMAFLLGAEGAELHSPGRSPGKKEGRPTPQTPAFHAGL